ncbi:MAG: cytidine deaminase [Nitrososphaerota archaeon]|jgi:cytidine deaminase|nr:cytidine deaminase [Nitrososphaerota archaeon]MDG6957347.1 cytidine deaminase [Nitrososphaerota archaeon]MDG6959489.1 cytidine deaminase [Nitrososphaerota archaeon]MDG6962259.1 cytidine deaminase [Nitrososphaerota archaeon]MDG6968063.1 cytidine deaminase [Nitrososphaerota archaeon]
MAKKDTKALIDAARKARENAYSPYSGVKIGAAVLTSDGSVYTGANIENASYGLSCCAERTAMFKAVSEGAGKILAIAVVGKSEQFTRPCGACRQVMVEFNPAMTVMMRGVDGFAEDAVAESLLPTHFNPPELSKR